MTWFLSALPYIVKILTAAGPILAWLATRNSNVIAAGGGSGVVANFMGTDLAALGAVVSPLLAMWGHHTVVSKAAATMPKATIATNDKALVLDHLWATFGRTATKEQIEAIQKLGAE
jgi:hypothetical protein